MTLHLQIDEHYVRLTNITFLLFDLIIYFNIKLRQGSLKLKILIKCQAQK